MAENIRVIKIGGSVLTGPAGFRDAADAIAARLAANPRERLVVVVSAESGVTDSLLATANAHATDPDPVLVDLLWSTGELRSVALLGLSLNARGVRAVGVNVHQTGLRRPAGSDRASMRPLRLRGLLARNDVIVVPGFLARADGDGVVSLGRGGSDLTAVLLAAGLRADACELIKDVPGYFTADPHLDREARRIRSLDYAQALDMADAGCALVQRDALEAARAIGMPLVVRGLDDRAGTVVQAT